MNIAELILELQKIEDKTTLVTVAGYEGGYTNVSEVKRIELQLNVNKEWYYGAHEEKEGGEKAVVIE